jgi:hypothetical protein
MIATVLWSVIGAITLVGGVLGIAGLVALSKGGYGSH